MQRERAERLSLAKPRGRTKATPPPGGGARSDHAWLAVTLLPANYPIRYPIL
jgi:hypothetical protein